MSQTSAQLTVQKFVTFIPVKLSPTITKIK